MSAAPSLNELVAQNKVLFHAFANMEDGTESTIQKFSIKFPPKTDPEYSAQVKKCLGMMEMVSSMGGNIDLSGPRAVIGDLVHLQPQASTGSSNELTMRFQLSSPEGIKLGEGARMSGQIPLGNGKTASYQVKI
jgi:hypothetical protein